MIRVNDDWVIDVDDHNYILKKDLHRMELSRDKKTMVPAFATKSYHPSLSRALERLHEEIIRDRLKEADRSLAEACGAIRECTDEWRPPRFWRISMNEQTKTWINYCNTCKYVQTPMTEEPCKACVPANLGGPDMWAPKYTKEDIAEIRAEQEIAYRRDNGL